MNKFTHLEDKVKNKKPHHARFLVGAGLVSFMVGAVLLATGIYSINSSSRISADSATADTASATDVVLPPVPGVPARETDTGATTTESGDLSKTFPAGWSMVAGSTIEGYDLIPFKDAGLILYSFNDPAFPNRDWTTYPSGSETTTSISAYAPMGYYVYNPAAEQKVTLKKTAVVAKKNDFMYARGWHILYWPNALSEKNQFMSSVKLVYSDGSTESLASAMSQDKHMASIRIYVVNNEKSAEEGSIKELTGQDTTTTISKIPQNSYFWIYLRRTKDRVVNITVAQ